MRIVRVRWVLQGWLGRPPVHMLHIGKTAGSAIKKALRGAVSSRYEIYMHGHDFRLRDVPRGNKCFFFLRDPVSRFVSAFYSRKRQGRPRIHSPWTEAETRAFERFPTANDLAEALSSDDATELAAAQEAMRNIGHVRTSYWDWFGDEATFVKRWKDVLLVGRQETTEADFEVLRGLLGLEGDVRLPSDKIDAHRNPDDVDRKLSEVARRNLEAWYSKDYAFLDLCSRLSADRASSVG